jgi:hypothetical protein
MKVRILALCLAAAMAALAYPAMRPVVTGADGAEYAAGQLMLTLDISQRGKAHLTTEDGVMLFGIPALDEINRRLRVDDVTPVVRHPRALEIAPHIKGDLIYIVQFNAEADVRAAQAEYNRLAEVEDASPNYYMRFDETPNDPYLSSQWHIPKIMAPQAWDAAHGDSTVLNMVIDQGVDYLHPDLEASFWINTPEDINGNRRFDPSPAPGGDLDNIDQDGNGYNDDVIGFDLVSYDADPMPNPADDHGSHCHGIINAVTNNAVGITGETWNNRSLNLRCGYGGGIYIGQAVSAIYYGVLKGVFCYTMSFGSSSQSPQLNQAGIDAWGAGAVLFGSAGNEGLENLRYPGCNDSVCNTAASTSTDYKAGFSNYGTWVDVSAPGQGIYSTVNRATGNYAFFDGTSMACPSAGGVACWIKSFNPSLNNAQVMQMLYDACDPMPDPLYTQGKLGAGRVNMANAVLPLYYTDLHMTDWRFNDATGNNNGRPDPGEVVSLIVTYANSAGFRDASSVKAVLTAQGTSVEVVKDTAGFPDIPAGGSGNCSSDSFVISVPECAPPQNIRFALTVSATPDVVQPDTFFTVRSGEPRTLIVDDDLGSDYEKYYKAACDSNGILYHTYSVQTSGVPTADTLLRYNVVIWFTGNDTSTTLTAAEQTVLTSYMDAGRNLLLCGKNIATDIDGTSFLSDYLHAAVAEDSAGKTYLVGIEGDPIADGDTMVIAGAGGANNGANSDGVRPIGGAIGGAFYKDYPDTTVQAFTHYVGSYKLVFFATAFEAINHSATRYLQRWTLMGRIFNFFGEATPGVVEEATLPLGSGRARVSVTPNPFARNARVQFNAPVAGPAKLRVYTAAGQLVYTESRMVSRSGPVEFELDGARLGSGAYIVQVSTPAGMATAKTTVLK